MFLVKWKKVLYASVLLIFSTSTAAGCSQVDSWLEVVKEWGQGNDFNRMESQHFRQLVSPAFHSDVIKDVWGEAYAEMSDRKRTSIHGMLNKCSKEAWVRFFLSVPFTNPPEQVKRARGSDFAQWQLAIESVNAQSYAQLKSRRQQQVAAAERAVEQRANAIAAAKARKEQMKQIQQEKLRLAELETETRIALVNKHASSGPFRGAGASYLNALYLNDREALTEYDHMFSSAYSEMMKMYKGSAYDALGILFLGTAGSNQLGQKLQAAAANLSMVTSVAGVYVLYYEHAYPECMDAHPLVYQRTTKYEWVTKNSMGTVLSRSPGWTKTDRFNINRRFSYVWDHMGDIEKGNAVLTDMFFGKRGAITLSDAMSGMSRSMGMFSCNSKEMRQLEENMLSYFKVAVEKMDRAIN